MASLNQAGRHNHGGGNDAQSGASPEMDHGAMPGMPPMPGMAPPAPNSHQLETFRASRLEHPEDHQMRNPHRLRSTLLLVLLAFVGPLFSRPASSATLCAGLPPSTLLVYAIKASPPEMVGVSAEELARSDDAGDLSSHHTLMVSASDLVTWFDIMHRIVPREDGSVCDAPSLVRLGFGTQSRRVFLTREAAADPCVRRTLLDHEAAHNRAVEEAVDQFIDRQKREFQRGLTALKQTPAPDAETAKRRSEQGLRIMVTAARLQLFAAIRTALARVDEPVTLAALENACGGKVRQLEASSG